MRGKDHSRAVPEIILKNEIYNFASSLEKTTRLTRESHKILQQYRKDVGDDEAMATTVMGIGRGTATKRTNHKFLAIEVLPHYLSQAGIYDTPPDPRWNAAWEIIRAMEPLEGCVMAEPRTRVIKKIIPAVLPQDALTGHGAPLCIIPKKRSKLACPVDIDSPEETVIEDDPTDLGPTSGAALMQWRRPPLVSLIFDLKKTNLDLRERLKTIEVDDPQTKTDKTLRDENSKLKQHNVRQRISC